MEIASNEHDYEAQLLHELFQEQKEESESSFFKFFVNAWPTLEPRFDLDCNWHVGLIGEHLEAVHYGQIEKLIVNIPTRYLKTQLCTIAFPAWVWIKDARKRFITWGYSDALSVGMSWKRRELIESDWYQGLWGDQIILKGDQNTKGKYANTMAGSMFASSTGGTMTGEGCDYQIIDDPVKPSEAENDNLRIKSIDFWSHTASSRFDDKKKKSCILVMQRLHQRDLTGHFIETYPDACHLKIPNKAPVSILFEYPISKRTKLYQEGEILQPNREDQKALDEAKKDLGSFSYSAQRQQEPVPRGGGIFKDHWFRYYDVVPDRLDLVTISADCAFKDLESSDNVALQVWGQKGANHYLLKQYHGKMGFLKTINNIIELVKQYPTFHEILIEEAANGIAIIEALNKKLRSVIGIRADKSKVARATACEPEVEAGQIFLPNPEHNPWIKNLFLPEVTSFPKAINDDQVDAMTQYLNRARTRNIGSIADLDDFEEDFSGNTFAGGLGSNREY